jgi:hypothetical protein
VLPKSYRSPHLFPLKDNLSHHDTSGGVLNSHMHNGPTNLAFNHYKNKSDEEYYKNNLPRGSVFYGDRGGNKEYRWSTLPNGSIFDDQAWKLSLQMYRDISSSTKIKQYSFFYDNTILKY